MKALIMMRDVLLGTVILTLAACTTGGSAPILPAGNQSSPVTTEKPAAASDLDSRALPGYHLSASTDGPIAPGVSRSISLDLEPDPGQGAPALVEAKLDQDESGAWLPATAAAGGLHWTWTVNLPAQLTGQRLWLRVTDTDGNTAESGLGDFSLAP